MKTITIDGMTTKVFLLLMTLYLLADFQILTPLTAIFRYSFMAIVLIIGIMLLTYKRFRKSEFFIFIPAFLFQILYILKLSNYSNGSTYYSVIYQGFFFIFTYTIAMILWKKGHVHLFSLLSFLLIPLLLIIVTIRPEFLNLNTVGAYAYLLSFFPLLYWIGYRNKKTNIFALLTLSSLPIILIFKSDARSIFISIFIGLITWILWRFITKSKFIFRFYFLLILGFCYVFTVIYPKIDTLLDNYTHYNYLMIKYTGKSILSGREYVWTQLLELIKLKLYFGYGSGALPKHFMGTTLSSHNLFLQVTLQVGIVGLILLLLFLFGIWNTLWKNSQDPRVILVACFFVGIIVYQLFEVTLTQNNFGLTILQWLIIGLGLSFALNKKQESPS